MRTALLPLVLVATLGLPLAAQTARFIKVDIISKTMRHHAKHKGVDGPTEIHMRMPVSLAKGVLDMAGDSDIKINGENRKGLKPEQLQKLLSDAKAGDLLLEITTDKGDHIRVTVE